MSRTPVLVNLPSSQNNARGTTSVGSFSSTGSERAGLGSNMSLSENNGNIRQGSRGRTVILPLSSFSSVDNSPTTTTTTTSNYTDMNSATNMVDLGDLLLSYGLELVMIMVLPDGTYLAKCRTGLCETIYVSIDSNNLQLHNGINKITLKPGSLDIDMSIKRGLIDIIGNMANKILLVDGVGCIIINNDYSSKEEHYLMDSGNQTSSVLPEVYPIYTINEVTNPEVINMANNICAKVRDYCSRMGQNICADLSRKTVSLNELIVSYMDGWNVTLNAFRQEENNLTILLEQRDPTDPSYSKIRNSLCLVKTFIGRMNQLTISSIQLNGWTIPQLYSLIEQYTSELGVNIEKFNSSLTNL